MQFAWEGSIEMKYKNIYTYRKIYEWKNLYEKNVKILFKEGVSIIVIKIEQLLKKNSCSA